MLVDHRTYTIRPGMMKAQLDTYEKFGFPAQVRHLGQPIAYLQAESGDLNTLVHMWAYESAADREQRRAKMMQDPDWKTYLQKNGELGALQAQKTCLMVPVGFVPLKR